MRHLTLVLTAIMSCVTRAADPCLATAPPTATLAPTTPPEATVAAPSPPPAYEVRPVEGWTLHIRADLLAEQRDTTESALVLLDEQLRTVARVVPAPALAQLRAVPIFVSPPYPGVEPKGQYYIDNVEWLRRRGRDPAMVRAIEFTNARTFARDLDRMPMLVLHELAHAYHEQVLGLHNAEIEVAYSRARAASTYHAVERWHGTGQSNTTEPAYALQNAGEFFAETTEAFFGRNDFFPFTREDLARVDPLTCELLAKLWGVSTGGRSPLATDGN